jgi:prepilin-type N-terminal cleavage/methylation domain-containing protein
MRPQTGFTLIELIIVIVILGILAVTAAPKFIDITADARLSVLDSTKAALESGRQMSVAMSNLPQRTISNGGNTYIDFNKNGSLDASIDILLDANGNIAASDIVKVADIDGLETQNDKTEVFVGYDLNSNNSVSDDNCYIHYTAVGKFSTVETGC